MPTGGWCSRCKNDFGTDSWVAVAPALGSPSPRAQDDGDPRQPAYDAVFAQIRREPPRAGSDYQQAAENARVWRCVTAALDAIEEAS
ncbi:hypothetical protein NKG94_34595 [Micromonospora sp. M12]